MLATLTGIYFLKQHKTSKEMVITIIGLVLILVAASVTVFINKECRCHEKSAVLNEIFQKQSRQLVILIY